MRRISLAFSPCKAKKSWKSLKFGSSKVYAGGIGMPGLSPHTKIERFQREL